MPFKKIRSNSISISSADWKPPKAVPSADARMYDGLGIDRPVIFRPMKLDEAKGVLHFLRELALSEGKPFDDIPIIEKGFIQHAFVKKHFSILIAEFENKIVGVALYFISLMPRTNQKILYLDDLIVHPNFRGRGFGTRIMAKLSELAQQHDCVRMQWESFKDNEKALEFYAKIGASFYGEFESAILKSDKLREFVTAYHLIPIEHTRVSHIQTEYTHEIKIFLRDQIVCTVSCVFSYSTSKGARVLFLKHMRIDEYIDENIKRLFLFILSDIALKNQCCRLEWYSPLNSPHKVFFEHYGTIYDAELTSVIL